MVGRTRRVQDQATSSHATFLHLQLTLTTRHWEQDHGPTNSLTWDGWTCQLRDNFYCFKPPSLWHLGEQPQEINPLAILFFNLKDGHLFCEMFYTVSVCIIYTYTHRENQKSGGPAYKLGKRIRAEVFQSPFIVSWRQTTCTYTLLFKLHIKNVIKCQGNHRKKRNTHSIHTNWKKQKEEKLRMK